MVLLFVSVSLFLIAKLSLCPNFLLTKNGQLEIRPSFGFGFSLDLVQFKWHWRMHNFWLLSVLWRSGERVLKKGNISQATKISTSEE